MLHRLRSVLRRARAFSFDATTLALSVLAAVLLAWSLGAAPVRAQAPAGDAGPDTSTVAFRVQLPDSVVVTASRVAEGRRTTGRRVSVYTQQDVEALPVATVEQLLDVVAGVDVKSRGGFGVQSDLTLRGSTFNGVLLLLDGARINDPMTGHFLMDLPVPLSEIARVEVLRGPATALYGPDALGGVVHLITKTALRSGRMADTGLSASAGGRYGKNNLYDAGASARSVGATTTVSAAASAQGSDGIPVTTADGQPVRSSEGRVRTDFSRQSATAAASRDVDALGGATLYGRAGIDNRDFSAWHFYSAAPTDTAREATRTYWLQARLRSDRTARPAHSSDQPSPGAPATTWSAQLAAKQHADTYRFYPGLPANRHTSRMLNGKAQVSRYLGGPTGRLRLTGGASGQLRGIDSNGLGLHSDAAGGAFASIRWQPSPRLTLRHSTRVDYDPLYGLEPTPQLFVAVNVWWLTLRAGGGRAVRAPNYVERYISYGGSQGTPGLDAESAWSAEAGYDVVTPFGLSFHQTAFGRRTNNLIDFAKDTRESPVAVARNLHRVTTLGLETEAAYDTQVSVFGRRSTLRLDAAYTLLDASFDTPADVYSYRYALTSARHLVQGSATVSAGPWTLGLQGLWKDRLSDAGLATGAYGLTHTRLAYRTALFDTSLRLSAEVRNVFDTEYTEVFDAPMPGRTLLVGAGIQF